MNRLCSACILTVINTLLTNKTGKHPCNDIILINGYYWVFVDNKHKKPQNIFLFNNIHRNLRSYEKQIAFPQSNCFLKFIDPFF